MRIGIIGGGSLGLLVSAYLAAKHDVTLYVRRNAQLKKIQASGISVNNEDGRVINRYVSAELINKLTKHDLIFITVKQPQIDHVINHLKSIDGKVQFVFLQNGMGHIDKISSLTSPVYLGVVEHGANRISDNEVNHLGFGSIKLASLTNDKAVMNLYHLLHDEQFPFEISESWESLLKAKLLINAVINPLTALYNVPNGAIVSNPKIIKLAKGLTAEAAVVLQFDFATAWENVQRVARNTEKNTSSMRADILHKRQTEIEAISGYLLKGRKRDELPYTSFVYDAILALEERGEA